MRKLILMLVCLAGPAAGCGAKADPGGRETAEWVLGRKGTLTVAGRSREVKTAGELPEGPLRILRINLNQRPLRDDDLQHLAGLRNLTYLGLHGCNISDRGLEHLTGLRSLTELELSYNRITNAGLESLRPLSRLEKLYLYGTQVTDDGVDTFQKARPRCRILR